MQETKDNPELKNRKETLDNLADARGRRFQPAEQNQVQEEEGDAYDPTHGGRLYAGVSEYAQNDLYNPDETKVQGSEADGDFYKDNLYKPEGTKAQGSHPYLDEVTNYDIEDSEE